MNQFDLILSVILAIMYVILALKEVTVVDNGYEKKYSFKNFIVIVSLLTGGSLMTLVVTFTGVLLSSILLLVKDRKFNFNDIFLRFANPIISTSVMCLLFTYFGGARFPRVTFPENFLIIIGISFMSYLIDTLITIFAGYATGKIKKSFHKVFFQEYGWIYKYELWQAIYAILFVNCAAVLLYNNFKFMPTVDSLEEVQIRGLLMTGYFDESRLLNVYKDYQMTQMPSNFLYFISWQLALIVIMYIPLNGWLNSFKTFVLSNSQNISNAIGNMKEGIIILDGNGIVSKCNKAAIVSLAPLLHLDEGMEIAHNFKLIENLIVDGSLKVSEIIRSFGSPGNINVTEIEFMNQTERNFLNILVTPEVNRFSEITGAVITIENVTSYRQMIYEINDKNDELLAYRSELENRLSELQKTQEQLVISEKMAVIGQLVSGIAHEINTPLASIKANIDIEKMIIDMVKPEEPATILSFKETAEELFEVNNMAMERIIEIVKGLKNFARLDEADLKIADIHEGIDSTLLLLKSQNAKTIEFKKEYGDISLIKCYPQQLNQVLLNILVNAIQAIKNEGVIKIKTWQEDAKVFISISDSGEGISEDKISKIFDPGYTTKGVGVGTGLGLSISYKIISKHKGDIRVNSKLGEGTSMIIELPIDLEKIVEGSV